MYTNTEENRYLLVLQDVKGLTKRMHIPNAYCYDILLMESYFSSYNTFYSSIIMYRKTVIINISRDKGVNEKIICLCTSCYENLPAGAVSWLLVLWLLNFVFSTWITIAILLISHTIYYTFSPVFDKFPFHLFLTMLNEVPSESEYSNFQMYRVDAKWPGQSLYTCTQCYCDTTCRESRTPLLHLYSNK